VVVRAERHGEDEQQDRDEEQHAVVVAETGEGDDSEAERGEVGQPDGGDQVERGDQAAQQYGEQDADDGQHQRHDEVQVGGGVAADVVGGGVLASDAAVVGVSGPGCGGQVVANGGDGGDRGAAAGCAGRGQGEQLHGVPVGADELGGGPVRLVDVGRYRGAGRWCGGQCPGGAEPGVQAGQVVGGQRRAVGVQRPGDDTQIGLGGQLLSGGLQAGGVVPDRGGEVQQQAVGIGGGREVRGDGGGAGGGVGAGGGGGVGEAAGGVAGQAGRKCAEQHHPGHQDRDRVAHEAGGGPSPGGCGLLAGRWVGGPKQCPAGDREQGR